MAIEFEPIQWLSKCNRFEVIMWSDADYQAHDTIATDNNQQAYATDGDRTSGPVPTFSAAVEWCEARKGASDEVRNDTTLDQ